MPSERLISDEPAPQLDLRQAADAMHALAPETIAAWLGIPVDGALRVSHSPVWGYIILVFVVAFLVACVCRPHMRPAIGSMSSVLPIALVMVMAVNRVYADVDGISVGRGRWRKQYAWDDLLSITSEAYGQQTVVTTQGSFRLYANSAAARKLAEAIGKALDARTQGFVLPNEPPMPEGALSAPSSDEPDAERGLSAVDNGTD